MTQHPSIAQFMTPDPVGVESSATLGEVSAVMHEHDIRHLLVLEAGRLTGVVSASDVMEAALLADESAESIPIEKAARAAFACKATTTLEAAAGVMAQRHYDCAVVVHDDGTVGGIFTATDALKALRELSLRLAPNPQPPRVPSVQTEAEEHAVDLDRTQGRVPSLRVKRMLRRNNAVPKTSDGLTFGDVFHT